MSEFDVDAVVVGAGAVGLACAQSLARKGLPVIVLEKEKFIGQGVSSRNSEVIHAGLYYPQDSHKAKLCVRGRRLLYSFLEQYQVAYRRCGKLIVAVNDAEVAALEKLVLQAELNDVENVHFISGEQARAMEPELNAVAALLCEESGVFDSHGYMLAMQGVIEDRGGAIAFATPFIRAQQQGEGFLVEVGGEMPTRLSTRLLVSAPGLGAQAVAANIVPFPAERIPPLFLGKGNYFGLRGKAPFSRLIYPIPVPGALGTHYRCDIGNRAVFGPDLHYVEEENYQVDPEREAEFYQAVRRFWPALPDGALFADYAGIRPKIHGPGQPQPDFLIDLPSDHSIPGLAVLLGIESPGLTASLAIGEWVVEGLLTC